MLYLCMCTLLSFKLFDEFHPNLAESGGLKTRSVKRTDLVEGRNLVCTSREATSALLTRHQRSHLCIITCNLSLLSQLSTELFKKKDPFLHTPPFLQILASHRQRPETCSFQLQSASPASGQLLGIHWPSHAPLSEVPACSQQPTCPHQCRRGMITNLILERQLEDMAPHWFLRLSCSLCVQILAFREAGCLFLQWLLHILVKNRPNNLWGSSYFKLRVISGMCLAVALETLSWQLLLLSTVTVTVYMIT